MNNERRIGRNAFWVLLVLMAWLPLASACSCAADVPQPAATNDFNAYVERVELRLAAQHQSQAGFLAGLGLDSGTNAKTRSRLRRGETILEHLSEDTDFSNHGAMLHHWRGTAFVPGAHLGDFERLMKDFNTYPQHFSPEILVARLMSQHDNNGVDRITASMRVKQKHVLTVVMDMTYDVAFARLDAQHGYSTSRSTRIEEIDSPGTSKEHTLSPEQEHGFLWRLNTYWSYAEGDGGLYMQIETVSLTRSIPTGLGWAIKPYVESVPRESLQFTLRSAGNLLRR